MDSDPISSSPVKRRRIDDEDDAYGDDLFSDGNITQLDLTQYSNANNILSVPQTWQTQPTQIIDRTDRMKPSRVLVPATSPSVATSPLHIISSPIVAPQARPAPLMAPPGTGFRPPPSLNKQSQPASSQTFHDEPLLLSSDSEEELLRARSEIKPTNLILPGSKSTADFKATTARFAYQPSNLPQKRPADDMTSAYSGSYRAPARPVKQSGPARAVAFVPKITSIDDVQDWDHRQKIERIQSVLNASVQDAYAALIARRFNTDDAMNYIVEREEAAKKGNAPNAVDLTWSEDELGPSPMKSRQMPAQPISKSKREATGTKNMMQKYSHLQQKSAQLSEVNADAASPPAKAPLRRLKQGFRARSSPPPVQPIDISSTEAEDTEEEAEDYLHTLAMSDRMLKWFNTCTQQELVEICNCPVRDAELIISQRPFKRLDQIRKVAHENTTLTKSGKKRAPPRPVGDRIVDACQEVHEGLETVDKIVNECEKKSDSIKKAMERWGVSNIKTDDGALDLTGLTQRSNRKSPTHDSGMGTPTSQAGSDDSKSKMEIQIAKGNFLGQPKIMSKDLTMKDYQLVGLNWINLLYDKDLSCILADDMGLGKTCQVISFLSHLYEQGEKGPHLIVVPASTLENWIREFHKFSPELNVEPYHGPKAERPDFADRILAERDSINVVVTTYDMAAVTEDNVFMRRLKPVVAVFDEGHTLKNPHTKRYQQCMRIPAEFRLMLTGTPLQNNLQELISILGFLQPDIFAKHNEQLQFIFKAKAKTADSDHAALLSGQRIARARSMITPFILRRKKALVLSDLPKKTCRVEYCELTESQQIISDYFAKQHRNHLAEREAGNATPFAENWLMRRRQAAIHPLLFRWFQFDDEKIERMAKLIPKKKPYKEWSVIKLKEFFEWQTDFALHKVCLANQDISLIRKMVLKNDEWMDSGKVAKLSELLKKHVANGDRTLLFSQFTTVLDILEAVLETLRISFCRIDGATPIERRQELIDTFYEDESIKVFMLSTRSGGTGINLACANKVIIFDSSFNPQDDIQAENRAHRVGQTRAVEVIRLVTKGTVEEQIHALGQTKMALDDRVAGEGSSTAEKGKEDAAYKEGEEMVEKMLLAADDVGDVNAEDEPEAKPEDEKEAKKRMKKTSMKGEVQDTPTQDALDLKEQFLVKLKAKGIRMAD